VTGPGREEGWRRLHPLSPLVRSTRGLLAVAVVLGFSASRTLGSGKGPNWYDLLLPVVAAGAAVVNWLVTRWKLDGVTLRIETGLLRRDSRQLPIARIQAVDLVRPFLARMLGLAELRIRLAGGSHADGRLAYLTEPAAVALRARLLAAHHGLDPATPEPGEQVVVSVPTGRIVGSVVLSSLGPALVILAVGLVEAAFSAGAPLVSVALLGWWAVLVALTAWRRASTQYGFTVAASPDGIRVRRGLLGTVAETIPLPRVQALRMIQPLLWRPFGWCRLEVDVAGHPGRDRQDGSASARKALLPVGSSDQAWLLARMAIAATMPPLAPPPGRARWKAPLSYHFLAAGHDSALALTCSGRIRKVTTWVPLAKAQSVRMVQGPLQRRLRLATVHVDAAGRHVRAEFRERDEQEARRLVDELATLGRTARRREPQAPVPPPLSQPPPQVPPLPQVPPPQTPLPQTPPPAQVTAPPPP
jgi:putative membrane protein